MDGHRYYRAPLSVQDRKEDPVTPAPYEYLVTCPIDKNHRILNTHIMVHMAKCLRNKRKEGLAKPVDISMQHCRYNHGHYYPSNDIALHEMECPDRFAMFKYTSVLNDVADPVHEVKEVGESSDLLLSRSTSSIRICSTQDLMRHIRLETKPEVSTANDEDSASTSTIVSAALSRPSKGKGSKIKSDTTESSSFNDNTASGELSDDTMSIIGQREHEMPYGFRQNLAAFGGWVDSSSAVDADDDDEMWDLSNNSGFFPGPMSGVLFRPQLKMATKKEKLLEREKVAERFQAFIKYREENNQDGRFITKFITTPPDYPTSEIIDPELLFDEKDVPRWWDPSGTKGE